MEQEQGWIYINRRNFLQKLSMIFAGGIFANLAIPTDAFAPSSINQKPIANPNILESLQTRSQLYDYLIAQDMTSSYDIIWYLSQQPTQIQDSLEPRLVETKDTHVLTSIIDTLRVEYRSQIDSSLSPYNKDLLKSYAQDLTIYMKDWHQKYIWTIDPQAYDIVLERDKLYQSHTKLQPNTTEKIKEKALEPFDDRWYRDNWIYKLHRNHATAQLASHNIKLQSTILYNQERWNINWSGYTYAEWVKQTTVDGIIALKQYIDSIYWDTGTWRISWLTESADHAPWTTKPSHGWWDKVDISRIWVPAFALHHYLMYHSQRKWNTYISVIWDYQFDTQFHQSNETGFHFDITTLPSNKKIPKNKKYPISNQMQNPHKLRQYFA